MKRFIVMFYDGDMNVADDEWEQAGIDAHAVVTRAKQAGVWTFGGGFFAENKPFLVSEMGEIVHQPLRPDSSPLGGFAVLTVNDKHEAAEWAAEIARSCRCTQEVREMIWDDESL